MIGASRRLCLPALAWMLVPLAAFAQEITPACKTDLAAVEDSFDETMARLQAAGTADHTEKCAALHHHIEVMTNGRDVFIRCLPEGHDKGENVGQLNASIEDFQVVLGEQSCE